MVLWHISRLGKMMSKQMSVVLGHYVNQGLLRRESLSAVHACYSFVQMKATRPHKFWAAVARELRWMKCLLPVLEYDARCAWSPCVFALDDNEWGRGVVRKDIEPGVVQDLGRHVERWRLRDPNAVPTRLLAKDLILEGMLASGEYGDFDATMPALAVKIERPSRGQRAGQKDWAQYLEAGHCIPMIPSDIALGGWKTIDHLAAVDPRGTYFYS